MEKFVPYGKMSKKAKRKFDISKRRDWNGLNPITRIAEKEKRYSRKSKHPEKFI